MCSLCFLSIGSIVEEWDEDGKNWKPAADLEEGRSDFAAVTVPLSCGMIFQRLVSFGNVKDM